MKKTLLGLSMLLLASCGSKLEPQTTFVPNQVKDGGLTYHNYNMSLSTSSVVFTHVATVNSHILNGEVLQATGFEKSGNFAFVVYNTAGNTIRGGLDILDMSTLNTPTLKSAMVSENTEYAESKIKGNYLYMVGQKKGAVKNDAVLTVVDVTNKTAPVVVSELTFAQGYYATSIDIQGNKAYITVPNEGIKVVNITNPAAPALLSTEGASQGNSLFVRRLGAKSISLGGSSSHNVSSINGTTTVLHTISSQPQEAPSRFTIRSNTLYTNGGNTGLTILDNINSTPVLKSSTVVGGTGNGIAVDSCKQAFLAQGDLGLLVADVSDTTNPTQMGRFDFVGSQEDCGSANNVFLMVVNNTQYVFVADGLGGVKIVKVTNSNCQCEDEDDEDNDSGLKCKVYDLSAISPRPSNLPNMSAMTPVGTFTTNVLNVVAQTSSNSFPLFPAPLKTMKEWYGLICEGVYESTKAESKTISLGSDDGSKLFLDGVLTINNDGVHAPLTKTATVNMQKRDYDVRVEYFQGPNTQIQLELQIESATEAKKYMDGFSH